MVINTDIDSFPLERAIFFHLYTKKERAWFVLAPYVQLQPYVQYVESIIRTRILLTYLKRLVINIHLRLWQ